MQNMEILPNFLYFSQNKTARVSGGYSELFPVAPNTTKTICLNVCGGHIDKYQNRDYLNIQSGSGLGLGFGVWGLGRRVPQFDECEGDGCDEHRGQGWGLVWGLGLGLPSI